MAFFKVTKAKPKQEKNSYEEELDKEKAQSNQEESSFWDEKDTTY
jgi:hypothetical protein